MKRNLVLIGAGLGLVLIVGAVWAGRRVANVANAVNPLNPNNVAAQGANAIASAVTGREETLGGWLAELFDPATRAVNAEWGKAHRLDQPYSIAPALDQGAPRGEFWLYG